MWFSMELYSGDWITVILFNFWEKESIEQFKF